MKKIILLMLLGLWGVTLDLVLTGISDPSDLNPLRIVLFYAWASLPVWIGLLYICVRYVYKSVGVLLNK